MRAPLSIPTTVLGAALLASCASRGPSPAGGEVRAPGSAAAAGRAALPVGESGLRIRECRVADDPAAFASAVIAHGRGDALDEPARLRLERNGFRLVRLVEGDVDAFLEDLGGSSIDRDGWHGQAVDWRELARWPIDPDGTALAVDGRVERLEDGTLRLLLRGWTMPMESGPSLYVELLPVLDRSRPTRLDQMLGRRAFEGVRLTTISAALSLEPGFAYALIGEAPAADWSADGARAGAPAAPLGPAVPAPMTIGERLLRREAMPATRDVLVLVPRIPEGLFPPGAAQARGAQAQAAQAQDGSAP